jgi:hypothetical protein
MFLSLTFPDWLTNKDSLTLATWGLVGATLLLVLATIILFLDSFFKGREQRRRWEREDISRAKEQQSRWEREDRLREEDAKPKVAVEIGKRENAPEIVFRCFNLGNTIFFVDQMIITATNPKRSVRTSDLVGPPVLLPGTFISTTYDCAGLLTDGFQEANAVFVLRGPHGLEHTQPVWFYVSPDPTQGYDWTIGRLADRLPGAIVPQPRSIPKGQ